MYAAQVDHSELNIEWNTIFSFQTYMGFGPEII
jgi:hypothetical protein